jgi:arylformamidase
MTLHDATLTMAYDLSIPHPDIPNLIEAMDRKACAFRDVHPPTASPTGILGRPIDVFVPEGEVRGAVAMIHGGYWVRGAPTNITHLAKGPLANGVAVGFIPYGLCPDFTIGEAIAHAIDATRIIGETAGVPAAVYGHSAGGHLAASVVAAGVASDAVFVSGIYDLVPITRIPLNETLGLTEATAREWSPSRSLPSGHVSITAVVGENEPTGFHDQQHLLSQAWGESVELTTHMLSGGDHFSEIVTLMEPNSPLTSAVVAAARSGATRTTTGSADGT